MSARSSYIAIAAGVALLLSTRPVLAGEPADTDASQNRQERLLEMFGDEGIDADGDGTLTMAEIRGFFGEPCPLAAERTPGRRMGKGVARGSMMGGFGGPRGLDVDHLFRRLEHLESLTPPAGPVLLMHPEADTDGDDVLSSEEWTTFAQQARARLLEYLALRVPGADTDGDGSLSDEELSAVRARHETRVRAAVLFRHPEADTDGDGVLSDAEWDAFQEARAADRRAMVLARHPDADTDGDGVLSQEELDTFRQSQSAGRRAAFLERHPEADTDGDGVLTDAEWRAAAGGRRGMMHGPMHHGFGGRGPRF